MIAIVQADQDIDMREERFVTRIADMLGFDITEVIKRRGGTRRRIFSPQRRASN